jgi:streptogramin lyase
MKTVSGLLATVLLWGGFAGAANLGGVVQDAGDMPVAGVFVTARQPGRRMAVTVVSDRAGRYTIPGLFPDSYTLYAARTGYETASVGGFALSENGGRHDFVLESAVDTASQLPGNAWIAALPDSPYKARFVTGCTICHDAGAEAVRRPRSHADWVTAIKNMREALDIYSVIPNVDNEELAAWLIEHKFGERPADIPIPDPGADATADVVITEYDLGVADTWAHDMIVEPATGAAWVGDYPFDDLIRVDPRTGAQTHYKLPVKGGGMHTLHFDHEGDLWITLQLTDMIARFDPQTESFRIYGGFQKGSLIHSFAYDDHGLIQFDEKGRMWMSEFGINAVASLNPETGEVREYTLAGDTGHTYGIALDSAGRVWYTKYNENTFGMLDPTTGEIVEKQMPRPDSAPHRMDIDDEDRLYIPNSGYGTLAIYDIRRDTLEEIALPDPDTFPYAARFDGATGTVWVVGNGANSLYRYDPKTRRFDTYRMPAANAFGRMISIDYSSGAVWTALSNYPNKHAGRNTGTLVRFEGVAPPARD